jgi:hypothetical protein
LFYRARRYLKYRSFYRAIGGDVLGLPPIRIIDGPWCVVSMVAKTDVIMYLLALKAFYPQLGCGKVVAIIASDTPQRLRDMLAEHVRGIEQVILEDIDMGNCHSGGTWERLMYILDRSQHEYVMQLDCDTLPVSDNIDEVVQCVRTNTAFTISDGFEIKPLPAVAEEAEAIQSNYVGIAAERMFSRYPHGKTLRYVRGSSGFAGFARGGFTRESMMHFYHEMVHLVGSERWHEWGTEQCASNFAIANSPGAVVLPWPEYASFTPDVPRAKVKFFHFIGTYRFRDGYYIKRSEEVIAKLGRAHSM